ncbi:hypothetical protein DFS34DRAFT_320965 [Phlyctochytrium arcticum]|nr:hypothetical protein DFS34DRAFT_320965 [Phlyctochytrium arcticum]
MSCVLGTATFSLLLFSQQFQCGCSLLRSRPISRTKKLKLTSLTTGTHYSAHFNTYKQLAIDASSLIENRLSEQPCTVKFYQIRPVAEENCPYCMLFCVGVHNHAPPPSAKVPYDIRLEIERRLQTLPDSSFQVRVYGRSRGDTNEPAFCMSWRMDSNR